MHPENLPWMHFMILIRELNERSDVRAKQYGGPAINSDIVKTVGNCNVCEEHRPSLPQEPMVVDPPPSRIFEDVSCDISSHAGRDFFVYVDTRSGWPVVHQFPRGDTTSRQVIRALRDVFVSLGVPVISGHDAARLK